MVSGMCIPYRIIVVLGSLYGMCMSKAILTFLATAGGENSQPKAEPEIYYGYREELLCLFVMGSEKAQAIPVSDS